MASHGSSIDAPIAWWGANVVLERIYQALRRFARYVIFEWRSGIETERITMEELGLDPKNRVAYEPAGWLVLKPVLSKRDVREDDVFLDYGCGKGRVLYMAAKYPFKQVIGVELSVELAEIARKNIKRTLPKLTCKAVDIVNIDALDYDVPDDVTYVFFNNPFEGEIFAGVVEKLVQSLKRRPRLLRIIYYSPTEEKALFRAGAQLIKVAGGSWPYWVSPEAPTVRLYILGNTSTHETRVGT